MYHRSFAVNIINSVTCAGLAAVCVLLTAVAAPADNPRVDIDAIKITGTPRLFTRQDAAYSASWVVFQTSPRLRTVRQVVPELMGELGRSNTSRGRPNCIRATIGGTITAGSRYRVRFYARSGRAGKVEKLLTTRTIVARSFPGGPRAVPDCATRSAGSAALPSS